MSMTMMRNLDSVFNSLGYVKQCHKRQLPRRKRMCQELPLSMLDILPCKIIDEIKALSSVSETDGIWQKTLDLSSVPTKPDDLDIKLDGDNLIISGKSEITNERNGFKTFSVHNWSREMKIADKVKKDTIKAFMNKNNQLQITAEMEEEEKHQIPIKMN